MICGGKVVNGFTWLLFQWYPQLFIVLTKLYFVLVFIIGQLFNFMCTNN
jgi:hypothetical protein